MAKLVSVLESFKKVKSALLEEKEKKGSYNDPMIFKPVMVKGEEKTKFTIRFLPVAESKIGKPWVELKYHMFKRDGDNRFIKVIDPRSFSKDAKDPISELGTKLWQSDNAVDKETAKKYFSKKRFFTLVYVKDAPENQKEYIGKVLIFEIGTTILNLLSTAIDDYDNCFWDPFSGQDFLVCIKDKGGEEHWPDYSLSNWIGKPGKITEDEKEMDRIAGELEKITVKSLIVDKDGIKSAQELEDLLWGGIKQASSSKPKEAEELTATPRAASAPVAERKPEMKPAPKVDFGDENVAATSTKKPVEEKAPAKEEGKKDSMEFDVDLSDIDLKF